MNWKWCLSILGSSVYKSFVFVMKLLNRYRIIYDKATGEPYLERFYIFLRDRDKSPFPFNIFLHRFIRSDTDELHDHPWAFRTLILSGGYWEHTEEGTYWRGAGSYRYASADTFHRVELDESNPRCWTLFVPSKAYKDWGFKTAKGWVQHEEYFNSMLSKYWAENSKWS